MAFMFSPNILTSPAGDMFHLIPILSDFIVPLWLHFLKQSWKELAAKPFVATDQSE